MTAHTAPDPGSARHQADLPAWPSVLAVVAHPDDESFGLGAVIDRLARAGASVHVLCFTHGEASTLNETGACLRAARKRELREAAAVLGVATVDLLRYRDGRLAAVPAAELARRVASAAGRHRPGALLVFDETGITGHPDHRAATAAAVRAARPRGLPVLAWALPCAVAGTLSEETGQPFFGQPPGMIDFRVEVSRQAQCQAARAHASQIGPAAVLWRRLALLGDHEHLRWLAAPPR